MDVRLTWTEVEDIDQKLREIKNTIVNIPNLDPKVEVRLITLVNSVSGMLNN